MADKPRAIWSAVDNGKQVYVKDDNSGETVCIVSFAPNKSMLDIAVEIAASHNVKTHNERKLAEANTEMEKMRAKLDAVYHAGRWGIDHVGAANYGEPYLEIVRSGGCVHINAYHKQGSKGELLEYVNFQLPDGIFKKWAEAFTLMASEL